MKCRDASAEAEYKMEDVEVTPTEEGEELGVQHSFECDLGICGGRQNVNHLHNQECSTKVCSRTAVCLQGNDGCAAEASEMDTTAKVHRSQIGVGEDDALSVKKDHIELGKSFQMAVSAHDWALAESYIPLADPQRLNDGLCIALDSIWFLR